MPDAPEVGPLILYPDDLNGNRPNSFDRSMTVARRSEPCRIKPVSLPGIFWSIRRSHLRSRDVRSRPRGARRRRQAFGRHLLAGAHTRRRHPAASSPRVGCRVGRASPLAHSQRLQTASAPRHGESVAGARYLDLQRIARQTGPPTDELIQLYALECFLDRLTRSVFARNLVLKGGVLLAALDARRPTRDIDLAA
jgi:hypothetical protein